MRALVAVWVGLALLALPSPAAGQSWAGAQIAVSPDGAHVYATGLRTVTFTRDPAGGGLAQVSDLEAGGESIVVAPDGRSVYVGGGPFLHVFARDAASGLLTHVRTLRDGEGAPFRLAHAGALAVSPDGLRLYVAAMRDGGALLEFARDPATSDIAFAAAHPARDIRTVVVLGDGSRVYAAGGDGLLLYRRGAGGVLAQAGRRDYAGGGLVLIGDRLSTVGVDLGYTATHELDPATGMPGDPVQGTFPPLDCPFDCRRTDAGWLVPELPGGAYLGNGRDAIVHLRIVDGALQHHRSYGDGADGIAGLVRPFALALAPDGASLYAVTDHGPQAGFLGGILAFRRDAAGALAFAGELRPVARGLENVRGLPKAERMVVEGGARFTSDRRVEVLAAPPVQLLRGQSTVSSLRIAVDGVEGPVRRLSPDGRYEVELSQAGGAHRIGVTFTRPQWDYGLPLHWEGEIVLDQRRPVVRSARLLQRGRRGFALRLRARDDRSGVRRVQLAARRSRAGRAVRFRPRLRVRRAAAARWVRVHDRAGNASAWKRVRRP